jgi:uncharacterized phiE125 gp8 family phage protein
VAAFYGALRPLQAPATEPVTLTDAKAHCRIDNDYDDTLLDTYVSSARILAEQYMNRALFTQQWQFNITTTPPPTATPLVPQSLLVFPLNWPPLARAPLELPRAPLVSVDSVQWGPIYNMQPADPADYDVNLLVEPGYVAVKPQLLPRIPQTAMSINYTAGWSDSDPAAVPATLRHAIMILTAWFYECRGDVEMSAMPAAACLLMDQYRLWTFAG